MKTKVDENTTPETIIAEAMVGAGAPLMHSRVEEAVAGALRKAGMLVERSEQVCAWCPSSARGSAWHNDGKLHPSCGQIDHGQGWVPEYPVDVLMSVRVERDAALSTIAKVRGMHTRGGPNDGFCRYCQRYGGTWPCPTIRALGSVPSTGEGNE